MAVMQPDGRTTRAAGRRLVLTVDDSRDVRGLLHDVLDAAGYEVVGVPSAPRALAFMADRIPDVVITDLLMPGMSGFAFRAAMLRQPRLAGIPVIVLSGFWQRPSETLDASAVLSKPLNIDHLLQTVARLAGQAPRGTENPEDPGAA